MFLTGGTVALGGGTLKRGFTGTGSGVGSFSSPESVPGGVSFDGTGGNGEVLELAAG